MADTYRFQKDPDAVLDYRVDWTDWLDGDTIATSTWIVPSGITQDSESNSTTTATIWLSDGTEGTTYGVVNRITTTGGRTDDRTIYIVVKDK